MSQPSDAPSLAGAVSSVIKYFGRVPFGADLTFDPCRLTLSFSVCCARTVGCSVSCIGDMFDVLS